jgi:hypothetical protein
VFVQFSIGPPFLSKKTRDFWKLSVLGKVGALSLDLLASSRTSGVRLVDPGP